ncbi:MAG: hypothetical protein IPJ85_16300 [Flavobacteriales bacterium]|nr:hypothetical protein [Flavobacteriales bacterium]
MFADERVPSAVVVLCPALSPSAVLNMPVVMEPPAESPTITFRTPGGDRLPGAMTQ